MLQTPPENDRQQEPEDTTGAETVESPPEGGENNGRAENIAPADKKKDTGGPTVVVRYGLMKRVGEFRHNLESPPTRGTKVVVRTERGIELGEVLAGVTQETDYGQISSEHLDSYLDSNGPDYPFNRKGKVLRVANHQDIIDARHLADSAGDELAFCRRQAEELGLKMKLTSAEHILGGERIVIYFTAEKRVDYSKLVRRLARQYHTRIEMRQVGSRDEARLLADCERCGRQCCCREFLKNLSPVSMRMAKVQKATLDPTKISGRCGRLMCCLRYEDAGYEELRKKLPSKNTWVKAAQGVGRVIDTQTLTQLVRIVTPGGAQFVVANEDIIERDLPEPNSLNQVDLPASAGSPAGRATPEKSGGDKNAGREKKSDDSKKDAKRSKGKSPRKRRRRKSGKSKRKGRRKNRGRSGKKK